MADVMVEQAMQVSAVGAQRRSQLTRGESQEKLKVVLGVDDSGLVKALGDGRGVWQEVEERVVDSTREVSIRRAQKSKKAQQILGIDRTTLLLMHKFGVTEEELMDALQREAEQQSAACRAQQDRLLVKSNRPFTKALERLGVDPVRFVLEKRLGLTGKELEDAILRTQMLSAGQKLQEEEEEYLLDNPLSSMEVSLDEPSSFSAGAQPQSAYHLPKGARTALASSEKLRQMFGLDEDALANIESVASLTEDDGISDFSDDEMPSVRDKAVSGEPCEQQEVE
mmetsp:Transcript_19883/g.76193  ORF Transcript_19883/g.76193 Transcript_19883/m.76193 type:complete len:282 (-) Transcript_19883:542-1387(-)